MCGKSLQGEKFRTVNSETKVSYKLGVSIITQPNSLEIQSSCYQKEETTDKFNGSIRGFSSYHDNAGSWTVGKQPGDTANVYRC